MTRHRTALSGDDPKLSAIIHVQVGTKEQPPVISSGFRIEKGSEPPTVAARYATDGAGPDVA
ncbi:MAG: hypothetical protein ACR2RV_19215, partial [Verrucomicrobiales bacterium]